MAEINGVEPYVVDGFLFSDKITYNTALSEKKGVSYLRKHNNTNNAEKVLSLYNELIDKNIFVTPVGMEYLKELQRELRNAQISAELIRPLYVDLKVEDAGRKTDRYISDRAKKENEQLQKQLEKIQRSKRNSLIINIFLIILVIAMMIIASTTSNANILNYERVLQDKYAGWGEQLEEKEAELKVRENELESREASYNQEN